MQEVLRKASTPLVAALVAVLTFIAYSNIATATHQPADKVQATGSDVENVDGEVVVLSETMRVSSPSDLILQLTAECSIITELTTNNNNPSATSFGSVRMHIEIDGTPVPVAYNDTDASGEDDAADDDSTVGEVTFCNRAYSRTVTDEEDQPDGIDEESDYIRTRTANAFNWFAVDAGGDYYDKDNDNLLTIEVIADYDARATENAVADAFVGSRTLIVEPVHSQNDQQVGPGPAEASPNSNGGSKKP